MKPRDEAITLSIIIPTCNRAHLLIPHLQEIMRCKRPDMEVLVLVDESTDGTIEKLATFREELSALGDERLQVIVNPHRMGFMYNYLHGLHIGRGKYCQNVNDRDSIVAADLGEYIEYLTKVDTDIVLTVGKALPELDFSKAFDRAVANSLYSHAGHKTWSHRILVEQEKVLGEITPENAETGYNAAESAYTSLTPRWEVYEGKYSIHTPPPEQAAKIKQERNTGFHGRVYFTPESYLQQIKHFIENPYVDRSILVDYILGTYKVYYGFALGGYYKVLQNPYEMERYNYTPPTDLNWKNISEEFLQGTLEIVKNMNLDCYDEVETGLRRISKEDYKKFLIETNQDPVQKIKNAVIACKKKLFPKVWVRG